MFLNFFAYGKFECHGRFAIYWISRNNGPRCIGATLYTSMKITEIFDLKIDQSTNGTLTLLTAEYIQILTIKSFLYLSTVAFLEDNYKYLINIQIQLPSQGHSSHFVSGGTLANGKVIFNTLRYSVCEPEFFFFAMFIYLSNKEARDLN